MEIKKPSLFSCEQVSLTILTVVTTVSFFIFILPFFETSVQHLLSFIFSLLVSLYVATFTLSCCISSRDELAEGEVKKAFYLVSIGVNEPFILNKQIDYCVICKVNTKRSSKHCKRCDFCMEGFDHHCNWVNNCIGEPNYKYFKALLFAAFLYYLFLLIVSVLSCIKYRDKETAELFKDLTFSAEICYYCSITLLIIASLALICVIYLSAFHFYLYWKDLTTFEYMTRNDKAQEEDSSDQMNNFVKNRNNMVGAELEENLKNKVKLEKCGPFYVIEDEQARNEAFDKIKQEIYK